MLKWITFCISVENVSLSNGVDVSFYDVECSVYAELDRGCEETGMSDGLTFDFESLSFELDEDHLKYCNEDDMPEGIQFKCDLAAANHCVESAAELYLVTNGQELND